MWSFQLYVHEIHPHGEPHWKKYGSFPGYPVVKTCAPMQGAGVQSLVKKLQSHTPRSIAKKKKKCVNHWNYPGSPVVKTLSFHYRVYRFNPSTAKKKKKSTHKEKSMTFRAGPHFMYFYSVHNSYLCIPPQKTFTDSLYHCGSFCFKILLPKEREGKGIFTSWSAISSRKNSGQALTLD